MVYLLFKGVFALGFRYEIDFLRFKGLNFKSILPFLILETPYLLINVSRK